jgi:hypothetical protein
MFCIRFGARAVGAGAAFRCGSLRLRLRLRNTEKIISNTINEGVDQDTGDSRAKSFMIFNLFSNEPFFLMHAVLTLWVVGSAHAAYMVSRVKGRL